MKKNKNEKGFFVIETIVVIAIVAIVVTYVFINFSNTYNRFLLSESYNNLSATNAALSLKEYLENTGVDYSASMGANGFVELSSLAKINNDYYAKLKEYLKIKTGYIVDTTLFYSDSNNLSFFDVKFQNYFNTLSKVKSKYILALELSDSNYGYISIYNYTLELVGDPDNEFVTYVQKGTGYVDPGYNAVDREGNRLDAFITGIVDINVSGIYYLTYTLNDITVKRKVVVYDSVIDYAYTGNYQVFRAPISGVYKFDLWGASGGGSASGKGAFTSGDLYLDENQVIFIYVGGVGGEGGIPYSSISSNGWNGGGNGGFFTSAGYLFRDPGGGGATDIRIIGGVWNNVSGLRSRIMVAGAGGAGGINSAGGAGGRFKGFNGVAEGGTAILGGRGLENLGGTGTNPGLFGIGGNGLITVPSSPNCNDGYGGGGGYYGGGGGTGGIASCAPGNRAGGGGGSSFISGLVDGVDKVDAIKADGTHSTEIDHFSGFIFKNMIMRDGTQTFLSPTGVNETGHSGNGYARVSLISPKQTSTLSKVRYIYNEINGSSANNDSHWVELQAYDINGNNISQGITSISNSYTEPVTLNRLTNGNTDTAEYIDGGQGISYVLLDLGQEYDLSSIRLWHYYADSRTYYDNLVKVAGSDLVYRIVLNKEYKETSYGRIIRSESID